MIIILSTGPFFCDWSVTSSWTHLFRIIKTSQEGIFISRGLHNRPQNLNAIRSQETLPEAFVFCTKLRLPGEFPIQNPKSLADECASVSVINWRLGVYMREEGRECTRHSDVPTDQYGVFLLPPLVKEPAVKSVKGVKLVVKYKIIISKFLAILATSG